MSDKFFTHLYGEVKKLFPDNAVETLIRADSEENSMSYSAVKLIHKSTGHSVISDAFTTQKENFIFGLIRLRILCDNYPENSNSID